MTRPERRAQLEAERLAAEQAQRESEADCIHWHCIPVACDWQGRITKVQCQDCNGVHEIFHDDSDGD